jgi:hypothetical protein
MDIPKNAATDTQNHGSMSVNQEFEGLLVPDCAVTRKQFPITGIRGIANPVEEFFDPSKMDRCHHAPGWSVYCTAPNSGFGSGIWVEFHEFRRQIRRPHSRKRRDLGALKLLRRT